MNRHIKTNKTLRNPISGCSRSVRIEIIVQIITERFRRDPFWIMRQIAKILYMFERSKRLGEYKDAHPKAYKSNGPGLDSVRLKKIQIDGVKILLVEMTIATSREAISPAESLLAVQGLRKLQYNRSFGWSASKRPGGSLMLVCSKKSSKVTV